MHAPAEARTANGTRQQLTRILFPTLQKMQATEEASFQPAGLSRLVQSEAPDAAQRREAVLPNWLTQKAGQQRGKCESHERRGALDRQGCA